MCEGTYPDYQESRSKKVAQLVLFEEEKEYNRGGEVLNVQNVTKHRQTNIELLRIFSMLMVLVIHYNVGTNGQTTHEMVISEPLKFVGIASLKSLSFICVNCFIIISGYFGIRWKRKSLCNYLFQNQ